MRRMHSAGAYTCVMTALLFVWQQSVSISLSQTTGTQPNDTSQLKIVILTGESGVNIIKKKTAVRPVVEVRDKNNLPVPGAYVAFDAPVSGAHVTFAHGSSTFSTITDASGRASVHLMKPVGQGAFKIAVHASFQGHIAAAAIPQTNYMTAAAASAAGAGGATGAGGASGAGAAAGAGTAAAGGISGTMIGVIAGAVAAGVVTAVAVSKSGGSKTTTTAPEQGTIGSGGSPTIGPPH